ncbi:MAG: SCO family protein, partial [Bacilli bacterium]
AFGEKFGVDWNRMHMLTGYTDEEITAFSRDSFKGLTSKPSGETQVLHSTSFYLVDKDGVVQKKYDGVRNTPYEEILSDISILVK